MTDRFILKIDPPQPCQGLYPNEAGDEVRCTLLTGMAEASWGENAGGYAPELSVDPYYWRHLWIGFPDPTPEELELEHLCMTNFVVNHFGGKGTAQVLGPCPTDSILPPYEPWEDDDISTRPTMPPIVTSMARSGMCVLSTSCGRTVGNCSSLPKVAWNAHRRE